MLRRALDFGWTWGLIPLKFHGQSSPEENSLVFSTPQQNAPRFKLGTNRQLYGATAYRKFEAPLDVRSLWHGKQCKQVRSCIICTKVADSGITIPNIGVVNTSGVSRRVSVSWQADRSHCQCTSKLSLSHNRLSRWIRLDERMRVSTSLWCHIANLLIKSALRMWHNLMSVHHGVTQLLNSNHVHPDGDVMTRLLAYHWFCTTRDYHASYASNSKEAWNAEIRSCKSVGLLHHITHVAWEQLNCSRRRTNSTVLPSPHLPKTPNDFWLERCDVVEGDYMCVS